MKRRISVKTILMSLLIILLAGFSFAGCSGDNGSDANETVHYSIGAGGIGGTYYPVGVGISELINENMQGISSVAEETGGAAQNIEYLEKDQIEIGFTTCGTLIAALKGEEPFSKIHENFSLGWKLFDTPLHVLALKDSKIRTMQDLKGKRVSVGRMGAAANVQSEQVFSAHGLDPKDVNIKYIHWAEAADALLDGQLDVAVMFGSVPHPSVQAVCAVKDIVFIEPERTAEEELKGYGLTIASVPANTYKSVEKDTEIINDENFALIRNDIPEDVAYEIIKLVFENKDELIKKHPTSKYMEVLTPEEAQEIGCDLHPGAIKYYNEIK